MKNIICLLLSMAAAVTVQACDESCRKQSAMQKFGVEFAGYLSRRYCSDMAAEFMTTSMRSLQAYRDKHLQSQHPGGMKNTSQFISQRKEWLEECDHYLSLTEYGRIFKNAKTTEEIISAMESVSRELDSLISGVTYTAEPGKDSTSIAAEKFDHLFELVDQHKTLLQLKGQLVIR